MIEIREANAADAKVLAGISKRAFDTDTEVGSTGIGGPPNYDSIKWHEKMIGSKNVSIIVNDGEIIGGVILFRDKDDATVGYIGRIFIDPRFHKRGYGIDAMKKVEEMHKSVICWRLETPKWNIRTKNFYEKLGYIEMKADEESRYFQKTV